MPQWPKLMEAENVRLTCFNAFVFIDNTGGTGGGLFRYMYGRFLQEAAEVAGDARLAEVSREIYAIGDRWQEAATVFKDASSAADPASYLDRAANMLRDISEREQTAWRRLEQVLTR